MAKKDQAVQNGTEVSAPAPKRTTLASIERLENDTLKVALSDSTEIIADPSEFSDEIKHELMLLGLGNKLRDSWASAKGDLNFAKAAANKVLDNLKAGLFTASRASGGGVQKVGELVQAIANLKGKAVADIQEVVDAATPEQIAGWRKNAQVKVEILRLRTEAARARLEKSAATESPLDF